MFLPYFIAILLGLATPSNTNNNCAHNNGTTVSAYGDEDPTDDGDPGDETPPEDGTGGDAGHIPPKNP